MIRHNNLYMPHDALYLYDDIYQFSVKLPTAYSGPN